MTAARAGKAAARVGAAGVAVVALARALGDPASLGLLAGVPLLVAVGWRRMDATLAAAAACLVALLAAVGICAGASLRGVSLAELAVFAAGLVADTWAGWLFLSGDEDRSHARRQAVEDLALDLARLREDTAVQEKAYVASENRRRRYERLQEAATALAGSLESERLAELTVSQACQLLGTLGADITLFVLDGSGNEVLRRANRAKGLPYPSEAKVQDDPLNQWVLSKGASLVIKDLEKDFRFRGLDMALIRGRSFQITPLFNSQGQVAGVLRIELAEREAMDFEDQRLMDSLAVLAGLALENARLRREAHELAETDGLTHLLLRRALMERLEVELRRGQEGTPLSLIMLDIDHFKAVNDTYGHPAGDRVLAEVAEVLRRCVRDVDVCGRYGGEEFVVLLPLTPLEGAMRVARRIREAVRARRFDLKGEERTVTVSLGVATASGNASRAVDLIAAADEALYRSKAAGRDRVTAAGAVEP